MSGTSSATIVTGSVPDMVARMRAVLPFAWFPAATSAGTPSQAPVLDSVLSGIGTGWAFCFSLLQAVRAETRLATLDGCFLDLFAIDFFGATIRRRMVESDDAFRTRLRASLLLPRATRASLANTLLQLTGVSPRLFEPRQAADTGSIGTVLRGYGSSNDAFQFLVSIDANGGLIRRESEATYLDNTGRLRIAPRHAARPLYVGGAWRSFLVEQAGFNLLKDSRGWSGWSVPAPGAVAGWRVNATPQTVLWPEAAVMDVVLAGGGQFSGPACTVYVADQSVCASAWVWIPSGHTLTDLHLSFGDSFVSRQVAADLTHTDSWQRLVLAVPGVAGYTHYGTIQLSGTCSAAMGQPIHTQCWQVEPGSVATSFIPSSGQIGVRDGDRVVGDLSVGDSPVVLDADDIGEAIGRTIPAGSVAWLALQHGL